MKTVLPGIEGSRSRSTAKPTDARWLAWCLDGRGWRSRSPGPGFVELSELQRTVGLERDAHPVSGEIGSAVTPNAAGSGSLPVIAPAA